MSDKKKITIVSPCFNEEENIKEFYERLASSIQNLNAYSFEFLIIDNCSTDKTFEILSDIASKDKRLKIIRNIRNFGPVRSPYYGILQSHSDATIYLASDLQDPPELIPEFIKKWESGSQVVYAKKTKTEEYFFINMIRRAYYFILNKIANITLVSNATGFGIYDKRVIDDIRRINDPNPYFRGLICELGFPIDLIEFNQPLRKGGRSKHNFYSLYDIAMNGFVSHSKIPLRLATFFGFMLGFLSFFSSIIILILKLIFWNNFSAGIAPILIVMFFLFGAVMIFVGILGEYIASIHNYVQNRPIVVERERVNFDL